MNRSIIADETVKAISHTVPVVAGFGYWPFALVKGDCDFPVDRDRTLSDVLQRPEERAVHAVPADWWARYRTKEKELEALRKELREFPRYEVSWHARLSIDGCFVDETSSAHPRPEIPKLPGELP